jgi:mycofactocin precursor
VVSKGAGHPYEHESSERTKGEERMKENLVAEKEKEDCIVQACEEEIPQILEEVEIEDLTVDGICGVY